MSKTEEATSGGIGVFGLLGVVFIVLKVTGYTKVATWSWTMVLAPFWIPWAIVGIIVAVCVLFVLVAALID